MYTGGALFVDMSSKQVENVFQQHLNTHGTLKAKQDFELKCKDAGVIPWSTSLTMMQPSPPSPTLPISLTSPKLYNLLKLVYITTIELPRRQSRPPCPLQEL